MKNSEALVWAAAFTVLTGMKLFSPGCGELLGERVWALLQGGVDYRSAVEALGSGVFGGGERDGLTEALGLDGPAAETVSRPVSVSVIDPTLYVGRPKPQYNETVQAFLRSQARFGDCPIPENVTVDMPELALEHVCPVDGSDSSGFGYRLHPLTGELKFHYGTDLAAETGEPVLAFAEGYVYAAGVCDSYGNYYIITHRGGISTLYAHLSEFVALEGERVEKGQLIGRVGETGDTTGPHLHFELRLGDSYLNPEYYI